jgi:hypothetical protein
LSFISARNLGTLLAAIEQAHKDFLSAPQDDSK